MSQFGFTPEKNVDIGKCLAKAKTQQRVENTKYPARQVISEIISTFAMSIDDWVGDVPELIN